MSRKKNNYSKEIQVFDNNLMFTNNEQILGCYEHFKLRYVERYNKDNMELSYESYWLVWIQFLRGNVAHISEKQMIRVMGNYIKDPSFIQSCL